MIFGNPLSKFLDLPVFVLIKSSLSLSLLCSLLMHPLLIRGIHQPKSAILLPKMLATLLHKVVLAILPKEVLAILHHMMLLATLLLKPTTHLPLPNKLLLLLLLYISNQCLKYALLSSVTGQYYLKMGYVIFKL